MDYTEDLMAAREMLTDMGAPATIAVRGPSSYNPATGSSSASTANTVVASVLLPLDAGRRAIMRSMATGDEQRLIMASVDVDGAPVDPPQHGVTIEMAGKTYTLVEMAALAPDGTNILYDCVVR